VIGTLTCTHLPSRKRRQTLPSRPGNRVIPLVKLRLASTGRFGSKRILSVGPLLTAFLRIMNGPDIGTVCFLGSHQELPLGICRLMVSRRLGTARTSSKPGILLDFSFFLQGFETVSFSPLMYRHSRLGRVTPPTHAAHATSPPS
jgi:hypothetical protein